jgi:hypothetical protein
VAIFLGLTASVTLISTWQAFGSLGSALTEAARNLLLAGTWSVVWKLLATALVLAMLSSRRLRRQAAL